MNKVHENVMVMVKKRQDAGIPYLPGTYLQSVMSLSCFSDQITEAIFVFWLKYVVAVVLPLFVADTRFLLQTIKYVKLYLIIVIITITRDYISPRRIIINKKEDKWPKNRWRQRFRDSQDLVHERQNRLVNFEVSVCWLKTCETEQ